MIAQAQSTMPALLVDPATAADMIAVSPRTLSRISQPNGDLPCVRIGTGAKRYLVRYRPSDLQAWIEGRLQRSMPETEKNAAASANGAANSKPCGIS